MQQFSLYHTNEGLLYKTACLLVEKCYNSNLNIVILVPNLEIQELLNKLMWTYSQKQFIPHGSKLDPLPAKQPVYITDAIENPNKATILMLITPINIATILDNKQYIAYFQRIIIIYDTLDNLQQITQTINKLAITEPQINYYQQNQQGSWSCS